MSDARSLWNRCARSLTVISYVAGFVGFNIGCLSKIPLMIPGAPGPFEALLAAAVLGGVVAVAKRKSLKALWKECGTQMFLKTVVDVLSGAAFGVIVINNPFTPTIAAVALSTLAIKMGGDALFDYGMKQKLGLVKPVP